MSIDTEFAVRKGIRNNPVLREVDSRHRGDLRRYMLLVGLSVAVLLFSAWQREGVRAHASSIDTLSKSRADEDALNRQFRLYLETLTAEPEIARRARALGLREPLLTESIVIVLAPESAPATGVVAQAR